MDRVILTEIASGSVSAGSNGIGVGDRVLPLLILVIHKKYTSVRLLRRKEAVHQPLVWSLRPFIQKWG